MKAAVLFVVLLALSSAYHVQKLSTRRTRHIHDPTKPTIVNLQNLKEVYENGFIEEDEYQRRKEKLIDELTGVKDSGPMLSDALNTTYSPEVQFLLAQMVMGLPRSYDDILPTGQSYWTTPMYLEVGALAPSGKAVALDSQIATQERTLSRYGLNLYDGSTWEIALCLVGLCDVAKIYEANVLWTSSTGANPVLGGLIDIRADKPGYSYGKSGIKGDALDVVTLPGNVTRVPQLPDGTPASKATQKIPGASFYRMIGPKYAMRDPLDGDYANSWKVPYPNNDTSTPWNIFGEIHFNDWKPITGENVWGAMLGPLQTMWIVNGTNMTDFKTFKDTPPEVQLALSILPAMMALQSPLGSMYHCPKGTQMFPADPSEETNVSNENNFSAYAAFKMLQQILNKFTKGTSDPILVKAMKDVTSLVDGLNKWFETHLMSDPNDPSDGIRVVYQGGHVTFDGTYYPVRINQTGGLAVDCQTWGMTVVGAEFIDKNYGAGTAYKTWQSTKDIAGYYTKEGNLGGVGYTDKGDHKIWSAEWSWGAIGMAQRLSHDYEQMGNAQYAADLKKDADSMIKELTKPMIRGKDGEWVGGGLKQEDGGYLYANDRFFIPWGWYANPIGATCSTGWAVMHEQKYNPFFLGGGFNSSLPDPTAEDRARHDDDYVRVFGRKYQPQFQF